MDQHPPADVAVSSNDSTMAPDAGKIQAAYARDPGSPLAPVVEGERVMAVDALRGFAVLGIFMMNIVTFSLPLAVLMNPMNEGAVRYAGEFTGLNQVVWWVQHLFFDLKMMTIFSMLFGAGLVLMASRAGKRRGHRPASAPGGVRAGGHTFAGIYYRRITWLLVMGLLHAYLLWYGDILTLYAICGLLLYPLRNLRPRVLIPLGGSLLLIPMVVSLGIGMFMGMAGNAAAAAEAKLAAGETPTQFESEMHRIWPDIVAEVDPPIQEVDRQVAAFRGSAPEVLLENAKVSAYVQLQMTFFYGIWRVGGIMLIGMALMRMGIFSAMRSRRFYIGMLVIGYSAGLPIVAIGAWDNITHQFDYTRHLVFNSHFNYIGSIFVAFGHVALVMLICQSAAAASLVARFAAVGRLALSNYLAQTVLATTFFYGWGFGFFGSLERPWLLVLVFSVWALQLAWSPWWLARFRYGPAEWLWRTLTYCKVQPLRR